MSSSRMFVQQRASIQVNPATRSRASNVTQSPSTIRLFGAAPLRSGVNHNNGASLMARAAGEESTQITGIVFNPWEEVQNELSVVQQTVGSGMEVPQDSLARCNYHPEIEAGVNQQINVEYNNSYIYHAMFNYFARDNVGLPGFAKYFKEQSDDERGHAEKLMYQQNKRGGRVMLATILAPATSEFHHDDKGAALWSMEISLALEKLNFQKLRELHDICTKHNDAEMAHYLEDYLLHEQAKDVYRVGNYVAQLRQVGKGHGTWHFDRYLFDGESDKLTLINGA